MKSYEIYTTIRDGKVAIWVREKGNTDEREAMNIWDLPKGTVSDEMLKAIGSAFERGFLFCKNAMNQSVYTSMVDVIKQ